MICTGAQILSIAEIPPPPLPDKKDQKAMYSGFDRLIFRGTSPCYPIRPIPTCGYSPLDEETQKTQQRVPFVGGYHYVFPPDMDGVVDNMYNAAYGFGSEERMPFEIMSGDRHNRVWL